MWKSPHHTMSTLASDIEDYLVIGIPAVITIAAELLFPFQTLGYVLSGLLFVITSVIVYFAAFQTLHKVEFSSRLDRPFLKIGGFVHYLSTRNGAI
jgi:hypothetical protein